MLLKLPGGVQTKYFINSHFRYGIRVSKAGSADYHCKTTLAHYLKTRTLSKKSIFQILVKVYMTKLATCTYSD